LKIILRVSLRSEPANLSTAMSKVKPLEFTGNAIM
jgi:hypothetical protein